MGTTPERLTLRSLSLPTRLVLAAFLIAVGLGYFSALVQLHFARASGGDLLPSEEDTMSVFSGSKNKKSQLERLLEADVSKPFNGGGTMRPAFTTMSAGWNQLAHGAPVAGGARKTERSQLERLLEASENEPFNGDGSMRPAFTTKSAGWASRFKKAQQNGTAATMLAERDGERLALLEWVHGGVPKEAYDTDKILLPAKLADQPITEEFVTKAEDGKRYAKIKSIIDKRCVRCHTEGPSDPGHFPLEEYAQVKAYGEVVATDAPATPPPGEDYLQKIQAEREGERLALVEWIKTGADRKAYEQDRYLLTGEPGQRPITPRFVETDSDGKRHVKLQSIFQARCVRCHAADVGGPAAQCPLENYESIHAYCAPESTTGMSLPKLAQTTHVHLLGFSMLFLLTGAIFSFTSYPTSWRAAIAPLALIAQVADISCWWLSRTDPVFSRLIMVTGGVVAVALVIHIVGSLWNMFDRVGKVVVILLLVGGAAGIGGLYVKVIQPQLKQEKIVQAETAGPTRSV
jgi:hypothetical protein